MARLESYRPSLPGLRELAKSPAIDSMLAERGQSVAQAAQSAYDDNPPHSGRVNVQVLNDSDSDRARVAVWADHPAALAIEADRRVLGSALGAAGGF